MSDQPDTQRPVPKHKQHSQETDSPEGGEIRTRNSSKRMAADTPRLRRCYHWDLCLYRLLFNAFVQYGVVYVFGKKSTYSPSKKTLNLAYCNIQNSKTVCTNIINVICLVIKTNTKQMWQILCILFWFQVWSFETRTNFLLLIYSSYKWRQISTLNVYVYCRRGTKYRNIFAPNHSNTHSSGIRHNQKRVRHFTPDIFSNKLKTSLSLNIMCMSIRNSIFSHLRVIFI